MAKKFIMCLGGLMCLTVFAWAGNKPSALEALGEKLSQASNKAAVEATGITPLMVAAQKGDKVQAANLLSKGADINAKDKKGRTAMWFAARNGQPEMIWFLQKNGAVITGNGMANPLCVSARVYADMFQKTGANSDFTYKAGLSLRSLQGYVGQNIMCDSRLSFTGYILERTNGEGAVQIGEFKTPVADKKVQEALKQELMTYSQKRQKDAVSALLRTGADPNTTDLNGNPLIFLNDWAIVSELVQYGADANAVNNRGETKLMDVVRSGYKDRVEYLLSKGANPNMANPQGKTALMMASEAGYRDIVRLLLKYGADASARDTDGANAGMQAADKRTARVIKRNS